MSKYASLLFSPEKYHEIGPFRFPVYNDLVPGEAKAIEELSKKQTKSIYNSIQLAKKISKQKGISTKEAIEVLGNLAAPENEELMYDYADELEALNRDGINGVEQQVSYVTVFMKFRGEVKLPQENTWTKTEDWETEDTEAMPTKLMHEISEMITWERDGWPEGKLPKEQNPTQKKS